MNTAVAITAHSALLDAYQEWRRLAELEGEAIRLHNWALIADCQKQLSTLQTRIIRLTNQAREEWRKAGVGFTEKENNLRQIISGLIELEMQNSSSLAVAKDATRAQLDQMDLARQNLKRVHRSYSPAGPALWNSFS